MAHLCNESFNVLKQSSYQHSQKFSALSIFHNDNEAAHHSRRALKE